MNTYLSDDPLAYTLLTYRPRADTEAWIEQWVKEGDFDKREDLVCFKPNGDLIVISPENEVFEYEKKVIRYRDHKLLEGRTVGQARQKTIYVRYQVGVEARFKPIYEQGTMNNV